MNRQFALLRSLNTRVTIFTLIIFVVSIWSLAFYATRTLRTDMERQLGEQQFSTVSIVAANINWQLDDRLRALEAVAGGVRPTLLGNPAALQILLEERLGLLQMFNGGTFVTGIDGTAIASIPISVGRIGVNYLDRDFIITGLKEGKTAIGKPVMGKLLKSPVFVMASPIRDAQGKVIGALMGVTDLSQPGFLDKITGNTYGKTGGYVLIERQSRLVITATDRSRIMESLPAGGVHAVVDRFAQGYEGSAVSPNPKGVEVLVSGKGIPVAGWYLLASLPTVEAFMPIYAMQQRMLLAAALLTLLAGALSWWMLRRQLAPMLAASKLLATLSATNQPPQPLLITRQDEIGDLIGGFNRLLETLQQRDTELRESEFRWKFAIEGSGDGLWDWNVPQSTVYFSARWKQMLGFAQDEIGGGLDEWSKRVHPDDLAKVMADVQAHLDGTTPLYVNEHRVSCKDGSYKWILDRGLVVGRDASGKPLRVIGTHSDITERKQLEDQVRHLAFHDALTRLPNRRLLVDRLSQTMSGSKRSGNYCALMMLDLDNFKPLNDAHGHLAGDLLLLEVARRLTECVRGADTVARVGGDEFVVMLGELDADKAASARQALEVAEKIRTSLALPYRLTLGEEGPAGIEVEHRCTASIGVAVFLNHQTSQADILKQADAAMYEAKEAGRNAIRFYGSTQ